MGTEEAHLAVFTSVAQGGLGEAFSAGVLFAGKLAGQRAGELGRPDGDRPWPAPW